MNTLGLFPSPDQDLVSDQVWLAQGCRAVGNVESLQAFQFSSVGHVQRIASQAAQERAPLTSDKQSSSGGVKTSFPHLLAIRESSPSAVRPPGAEESNQAGCSGKCSHLDIFPDSPDVRAPLPKKDQRALLASRLFRAKCQRH
jgi:hypothetical protein